MNSSRRNARGELTLQKILTVTASLVGRYGYSGTTIARITQGAGCPASSLYWFFGTKDALISAALEGTYSRQPDEILGWPAYDRQRPLQEQLFEGLGAKFTPRKTENPVRVGILVALEGGAADSPAQSPFARRRQRAREQIHDWWSSALMHQPEAERALHAEWLTRLTLGFLDGHYIADADTDHAPQLQRGLIVVLALDGAFQQLTAAAMAATTTTTAADAFAFGVPPETGSTAALLRVTRSCVAELGYEGATLAEIGQRSGIQRSSIYWRFKSKDELVRAAVAEPFLQLFSRTRAGARAYSGQWCDELSDSVIRAVQNAETDVVKAGLLLSLHRREPASLGGEAIRQGLAREKTMLTEWIADQSAAAGDVVDAAELAWGVTTLTEGLLLSVAFGQRLTDTQLSAMVRAAVASVVSGFRQGTIHGFSMHQG